MFFQILTFQEYVSKFINHFIFNCSSYFFSLLIWLNWNLLKTGILLWIIILWKIWIVCLLREVLQALKIYRLSGMLLSILRRQILITIILLLLMCCRMRLWQNYVGICYSTFHLFILISITNNFIFFLMIFIHNIYFLY